MSPWCPYFPGPTVPNTLVSEIDLLSSLLEILHCSLISHMLWAWNFKISIPHCLLGLLLLGTWEWLETNHLRKKECLAAKLSFIFSFGFEQDRIIWCVNVNDADCSFVKGFKCRIKDLKQEIVPRCLSYYIHFEITGAAIWLVAVWFINRSHSFCSKSHYLSYFIKWKKGHKVAKFIDVCVAEGKFVPPPYKRL